MDGRADGRMDEALRPHCLPGAAALLLPRRGAGQRNGGQRGAVPRRAEPCRTLLSRAEPGKAGRGGSSSSVPALVAASHRWRHHRCALLRDHFVSLSPSGGLWEGFASHEARVSPGPAGQVSSRLFPARPGSRAEGGWRCLWRTEVNSPLTKSSGAARKGRSCFFLNKTVTGS